MRNNTHSGNDNEIGIAKSGEGLRPKAGVRGSGRSLCSGGTPFPHLHTCNAGVKRGCPSLCPTPTQWLETAGLISECPLSCWYQYPCPQQPRTHTSLRRAPRAWRGHLYPFPVVLAPISLIPIFYGLLCVWGAALHQNGRYRRAGILSVLSSDASPGPRTLAHSRYSRTTE